MSKKDYERAAEIVQVVWTTDGKDAAKVAFSAFACLFEMDSTRFDKARFLAACEPGANVKARPRKAVA